jgi:hypothetical protein
MNMERANRVWPWRLVLLAAAAALSGGALAQQPPSRPADSAGHSAPAPADLEPAVDTTRSAPAAAAPAPASATQTPASPAAAPPTGAAAATGGPSKAASAKAGAPAAARAGAAGTKSARPDRLELDTTDITGNRELPKVLYIVPWKRSDLGDLVGKPTHSLLDEVLQPLDRDVFTRQNRYYDALKPGEAPANPGAAPSSGDKP